MYVKCTHPGHVDGTSCEDFAVGCDKHCPCCMTEVPEMTQDSKRVYLAEFFGWRVYPDPGFEYAVFHPPGEFDQTEVVSVNGLPDYFNDLNVVREAEIAAGIHDRNNSAMRVRWVNNLREIVGQNLPKNKVGATLVSDVDLSTASAEQRAEALGLTIKAWTKNKK